MADTKKVIAGIRHSIDICNKITGPRVLTLDEVLNSSGTGYEEDLLPPDGDIPAYKTLKPCVWLMGDILEWDEEYGYCDHTERDVTANHYGTKYFGFRVWTGMPTEEQMEATAWSE